MDADAQNDGRTMTMIDTHRRSSDKSAQEEPVRVIDRGHA